MLHRARRATLAAIAGSIALAAALPLRAQTDSSCPLPLNRQLDSIHAFKPIAEFLTKEPRCANCHGGVNPFIDGTGSDPADAEAPASIASHAGGRIARQQETAADGTRLIEGECRDCHNHMAPRADGSPSLWMTAPSFLSFVGKDAPTLCKQVKKSQQTAEHFLGHLENDNGGNAFGATAFNGDRGLDPDIYEIAVARPSLTHAELMQLGREWIAAMGGSFEGDETCGCEIELEGKFTHRDALRDDTFTEVSADLVWVVEPNPSPSASTFGDVESVFFKPMRGEITIHEEFVNPTIGGGPGQCAGTGHKTFSVAEMTPGALRYMSLQIAADGRYAVTLVIPDTPSPFPTWEYDATCKVGRSSSTQPMDVRDVAVILGRQEGVVDEEGIAGRLAPPIRRGPRTTTGDWTFKPLRNAR